jgi:predicted PurR-regulated permease PerM
LPAKKLVVSAYLQYILIGLGVLVAMVFVRQLSGVSLTFLVAAILACVLDPLVKWRVPKVVAVIGVFAALGLMVTEALLVFIIPVLGPVLGAAPAVLIALFISYGGVTTALLVAALFLVAQQIEGNLLVPRIMGGSVGVHPLWMLFATLAATALYGIVGAVFAVPAVAIVAATLRYLRGALVFERWENAPIAPVEARETPDKGARH